MTTAERERLRTILLAKQTELENTLRKRDDIAIEKAADALDEVQHASERELAFRNLHRESGLLRSVRAALQRMDEGEFGICQNCQEDISPKRLAAVPWTHFCLQCQERADSLRGRGDDEDGLLIDAA